MIGTLCEPLPTVLWIGLVWAILAAVYVGLGAGLSRFFGRRPRTLDDLFFAFWLGWAFHLAILEVWHLLLPIGASTLALVLLLGVAGWAWGRPRAAVGQALPASGLPLAVFLGVAALALGPLVYFDTGFYHLTTVDWIRGHAVVPGLGNLHGRLAFNSSFLLYAALLEDLPGIGQARYLANGLLMSVLLLQALFYAERYLRRREARARGILSLLLLGPITSQLLGGSLPSLSTDMPAFALAIVIAWYLLSSPAWAPLAFFIAAGIAVKLSFVVYGGLTAVLALVIHGRRCSWVAAALVMVAAGAVILVPWMIHGAYLSGYLLYPGGHLPLPVDWRVPRALALEDANWIYGLARSPSDHWAEVVGEWNWLGRWWREMMPGSVKRHLLVASLALIAFLAGLVRRRRPEGSHVLLPLAGILLLALAWWFQTAPNPRFAGSLFALLAAALGVLAWPAVSRRVELGIAATVFVLLVVPSYEAVNDQPYCEPRQLDAVTRTTRNGLGVQVAAEGVQCWELPLPCASYYRPSLAARRPGEPGAGFVFDESVTLADYEEGEIPSGFQVSSDLGINLVSGWPLLAVDGEHRVMARTGRFLVYTEKPVTAHLKLRVAVVQAGTEDIGRCGLRVALAGSPIAQAELTAGREVAFELELERDFNDVVLELLSPSGDQGGEALSDQPGRLMVSLTAIEISTGGD